MTQDPSHLGAPDAPKAHARSWMHLAPVSARWLEPTGALDAAPPGDDAPIAENIVVAPSHAGPGVSPLAPHALADRLAPPAGRERPFERRGPRRLLHRDPARVARAPLAPEPFDTPADTPTGAPR